MSIVKEKRLFDEVREVMRLNHYSIHTERTYFEMKYTHVLQQGGQGVMSPLDDLEIDN